jgi:hypothetical protein
MDPTPNLTEQLHNACRIGDTNTVRVLLDKGANPYEAGKDAPSALHKACGMLGLISRGDSTHGLVPPSSRLAVVRMLLDHKSFKFDVSSKRKGHERTVLEHAIYWSLLNSSNNSVYFRVDSEDCTHHGFNVVMALWTRGIGCRPGYDGVEDWFNMHIRSPDGPYLGPWLCCYGEGRIHLYRCCKESIENYQPSLISLLAFQLCLMRVHASSTVSASSSALNVFQRTWPPLVNHKIKEFLIPPMHVRKVMKQVVLEFKRTVNDTGRRFPYTHNIGTMLYDAVQQGHVKDVALLLEMENIGPSLNQECEWVEYGEWVYDPVQQGEYQEIARTGNETPLQFLARKGNETIYEYEPGEDSDEDRVREGYPVIEEMLKKSGCVATGSVHVDVESSESESDEED